MICPMPEAITDIDDVISALLETSRKSTKFKKVRVLGMDVRVSTNPNVYTTFAAMGGDNSAVAKMVTNLIHEDDREAFSRKLMETEGVDTDVVLAIIEKFSEVAAERPTTSPSGSSRGSTTRTVRTKKSADD